VVDKRRESRRGQGGSAFAGEHDFVAFGVDAHGEVRWFAVFGFGLAGELAAGGDDFLGTGDDVGDLEAHAGPSAFAFAAAVDADNGPAEGDFADDVGLFGDLGSEDIAVEIDGALDVSGPYDVFDLFDVHDEGAS
jgi:hypothetical protein